MIRMMITAVLLVGVTSLLGCQTLTRDREQQITKYSRISDLNRRMLNEDLDRIFLLDRPSSLSRWHVRPD